MNKFNKLYNLILESIIVEDINSKIKKAIDTLIKSGQLTGEDDPKIQLVKTIIKRNSSIDINGKTKLDQLLKANQKYINRAEIINLDSIPQFYEKQVYPNDVVIYKVRDSKAGQLAVRKIVDAQWGKDANPWCLITRKKGLNSAWDFWNRYDKWPKQIAFQDGQLLAFRASDNQEIDYWWNRNDKKSRKLRLKDRSLFQIPKPQWTPEDLKKRQQDRIEAFKSKFTYNEKTGRYDIKDNVYIKKQYIVNGGLPFPLGVINGNFILSGADHLITSIKNLPTKVLGKFHFHKENELLLNSQLYKDYMKNIPKVFIEINNLIYNQQTKRYDCNKNLIIDGDYLKDGHFPVPLGIIKGNFDCYNCNQLVDLTNGPTEVDGVFSIRGCHSLTSLIDSPKKVGSFYCHSCSSIKSLKGITPNISGNINISSCDITKLEYLPKIVNGNFDCSGNSKLKSLEGSPEVVKGNFKCGYTKISSFLGGPKVVEGNIYCQSCNDLVSLNGLPQKLKGSISCIWCDNLKITEEDRKKYKVEQ